MRRGRIGEDSGERGRTRTCDPCLKRALLYQLSYAPTSFQSNIFQKAGRACFGRRAGINGYLEWEGPVVKIAFRLGTESTSVTACLQQLLCPLLIIGIMLPLSCPS